MKITKLKIRNLFGIKETELDGRSVELTGDNGTGKTSVIDAIRYGLTNKSDRDLIINKNASEGEILIESDSGLYIDRKKRANQADYKSVKSNGVAASAPESFLSELFTPLQLNPVEFTLMSKNEQNRTILDLIEYDWDLNWIKSKFGEIPDGIDYSQNILQVLNDIQAENGPYFGLRQDVNREIRNKKAFIADIAKDIPSGYQADKWENFDLAEKYHELEKIRSDNDVIRRAQAFKDAYENKKRGIEADRDIVISANEKAIAAEREALTASIERMKAEINATEEKLKGLNAKLEDKNAVAVADYKTKLAQLDKDTGIATEHADKELKDDTVLAAEIEIAEQMKKHLNEFHRMETMEKEVEELSKKSDGYTKKIELARELPGEILAKATLPVEGMTVENGIPLINGLPISNLSEGEQLELCVDIAVSKPTNLQIILIDGAEKLSDKNREKLYQKCKEKGLQFIATRTTNSNELEINYL